MDLSTRHLLFQAARLARAANRQRRRRLAAELATYTSDADLNLTELHGSRPPG